jgi:ectoine hydroxylase-related dioxygenase (phytanoyl-CoA dioxygenase family)
MVTLAHFAPDAGAEVLAETLRTDGACIVDDVLSPERLDALRAELDPWIDSTPGGRDGFSGFKTRRTGALVARSPLTRELVMDPMVLGAADALLGPHSRRFQLHLTQAITIEPGQGTQPLHRDRLAWGGYLPREIEPQFNTIWALTDFTEENGATRVVPGSPAWDEERRPTDEEKTQAVMSAGSVLLYSGTVIHGGGENRSDANRIGLNITYCLGWLRTEENQYLSCPPDIASGFDPELQELLGYTMGDYALGYFSDPTVAPTDIGGGSDLRPPERALGRRPRAGIGASETLTGE